MSDNKFHDHLDVCKQCAKHPFNLCPAGSAVLLVEASRLSDHLPDLGARFNQDGVTTRRIPS